MKRAGAILIFFLVVALTASAQDFTNRPVNWAQKIALPGLANFYQVTTNLYRGAQPTAEGMARLQTLGVRYVISLRMLRSEQWELRRNGLKGMNLGIVPWHVSANEVVKFLKAATDTNNLPAFVHCQYGADRTGLMCAMYRIVVCDWAGGSHCRNEKRGVQLQPGMEESGGLYRESKRGRPEAAHWPSRCEKHGGPKDLRQKTIAGGRTMEKEK